MAQQRTHRTRMNIKNFIAFYLSICIPTIANSAIPPNYTAHYDVEKYSIVVGRTSISLDQTDEKLHYSQNVKLVGFAALFKNDLVAENSWITKTVDNQFLLEKYQYVHTNSSRNRDVLIKADWSKADDGKMTGVVKGTVSGNPVSVQTQDSTWDNFSFQLALINDVSDRKEKLSYNVISQGRLKKYNFSMLGEKKITLNDKEYDAIKIERIDGKRKTLIWLAPELHYIPVLIETYKNNDLETKVIIDTAQFNGQEDTDEEDTYEEDTDD